MRDVKTVVHPGEVNKIRELPQHPEVLVTHTDAPELYVWNIEKQPAQVRGADKRWPAPAAAEAVLTGHETPAGEPLFALAASAAAPRVASGAPDRLVLLWDLADAQDGILAGRRPAAAAGAADGGGGAAAAAATTIGARVRLEGHADTVEDVVFAPDSGEQLVSVGDDRQIIFWDLRAGHAPVARVKDARGAGADVHCVDWNRLDANLVATGAADGSLRVWDRRRLPNGGAAHDAGAGGVVAAFRQHSEAVMRVEWHPAAASVLASGGDDHLVLVWDLARGALNLDKGSGGGAAGGAGAGAGAGGGGAAAQPPPELLFKHVGHRDGRVVDFQWCPDDPWTMLSVSFDEPPEDAPAGGGGGGAAAAGAAAAPGATPGAAAAAQGRAAGNALQIWRINDMIYRAEDEVIEEMEQHRDWILEGLNEPPRPKQPPAAPGGARGGGGGGGGDAAVAAAAGAGRPSGGSGGGDAGAAAAAATEPVSGAAGGGGDSDAGEGSKRRRTETPADGDGDAAMTDAA